MPTLSWMGRENAVKATKDVVLKILRENRDLGYGGGCLAAKEDEGVVGSSVPLDREDMGDDGHAGAGSCERLRRCYATFPPNASRSAAHFVTLPKTDNVLVHGDNLEALKALLPFYAGEVKCVYIDPPYNTGSAFEHYDDNLEHATWLNMMYPRLKLLREFLREDGSIWISIDDREGAYLRVICDEIFGRQNFVSNVSWQRTYSTRNDAKGIVNEVEHILVYSKREGWQPNKLARTEEMDSIYKNPDNDPKGAWTSDNPFAPGAKTHQGMVYAIQHPFTGELVYPVVGRCWTFSQEEMLAHMSGWCPYELREIDDAERRAAICGVGVDEVRKGVKAIMLADAGFQTGLTGLTGLVGSSVPFDREGTGGSRLSRPNGGDAGWSQFTATEFAATATGMPYRKLVVYGEWNRLGEGWLEATSRDLLSEFPEMKGFSFRNLNSMRQWYSFYSQVILKQAVSKSEGESAEIGKQPVSQLGEAFFSVPWGHHLYILQRCKDVEKALFYLRKTVENNWSRSVLLNFLDTDLYEREGRAVTNFAASLPAPGGDLAQNLTRDPYCFGFLELTERHNERQLKDALVSNIEKFMLELGTGFAYMGREYRLEIGDREQFLDMLFYNVRLRCYVVIEVKTAEFEPSFVGQLGAYVVAVDKILRKEGDNKTIGLLICKTKDNVFAKYALEATSQPIGISEYELSRLYPEKVEGTIPTVEEIESHLLEGDK